MKRAVWDGITLDITVRSGMGAALNERSWEVNLAGLARSVLVFCLAANAVILLLDVGQHLAELWYIEHIKDLSNVLLENSVGTWFSVVLNAAAGVAAFTVALCCRRSGKGRRVSWGWSAIALFFLYISLDDHLVLHERLSGGIGRAIQKFQPADQLQFLTYEWIYVFVPLFALFGLFMLVFLFRELGWWRYRLLMVLAFGFWALAVGLDAWEGTGLPYEGLKAATGLGKLKIRHAVMLAEEMMELLGTTLFLYLFLCRARAVLIERPTVLRLHG